MMMLSPFRFRSGSPVVFAGSVLALGTVGVRVALAPAPVRVIVIVSSMMKRPATASGIEVAMGMSRLL